MVVATFVSFMLGRFPIEPGQALAMIGSLFLPIEPTWTDQQYSLFMNVRLPRILLALLIGACLSAAGAAFQGTFQNPLVSPDILGASQGAAFGAALAILTVGGAFATSTFAFAFSMITVLIVLVISNHAKGNRVLVVVLAGVMVSSLFQSGVSFCKLVADPADDLPAITYWLMGSLSGVTSLADVARPTIPMAIGMAVLFAMRWRINILTMGDDEASTMGINAKHTRYIVLLAATLVTAASVSVSGIIGFVGLVVPHLARMIVGSDYRKLIPASALLGASFLLIVDDVARLATSAEIPIGILTAFIGVPFFLYLITRKKKL
ncbi:MAG: iron ABC transporter permease [Eggerthellaceae bacterium]|nr:iron ABC transporter permease [Eggerthellaceae bacterium]